MDSLFKQYEGIFEEKEEVQKEKNNKPFEYAFSPFALQDAIGEKSAKKAWIEYQKLRIFQGIEAEELIFRIVSKTKEMIAITLGATKEDLGVKSDFPFNKSKKDAKNWQKTELKGFYTSLIETYHRSRMGGDELDIGLEKILLSI
jgi:hypothetical protein